MRTYIELTAPLIDGQEGHWGDPDVQIKAHAEFTEDGYRLSSLSMGSHSGTHIDSPAHILKDGRTLDQIPLERFFVTAFVLDCRDQEEIDQSLLKSIPDGCDGLLFCGKGCYLSEAAAAVVVEQGIGLVGFESLSCDHPESPDLPVHRTLLSSDVLIIERLVNLDAIVGTSVELIALPLLFTFSDGAPARVIARTFSSS